NENQESNAEPKDGMRNLADRLIDLPHLIVAVELIIETAAATTQIRQPRSKANDKPFFQIEWLKKNLLHQLERFSKRLEDLDVRFGPVHAEDSETFSAG